MHPDWPQWSQPDEEYNLREVAPNLWVGAELSPGLRPAGPWHGVVDLYGSSSEAANKPLYAGVGELLQRPFYDGANFPKGTLDDILGLVVRHVGKGPILLHCQAGLSRSASAAYAMMCLVGTPHREALRRVKVEKGFPRAETLKSARRWVATRKPKQQKRRKAIS